MSCSMLGCLLKMCTVPSNQLTDTKEQFELERNVIPSQHWDGENSGENSKLKQNFWSWVSDGDTEDKGEEN